MIQKRKEKTMTMIDDPIREGPKKRKVEDRIREQMAGADRQRAQMHSHSYCYRHVVIRTCSQLR